MSEEMKEMGEMPIWQDHERRITTLENTFSGFAAKVENVEKKIDAHGNKQEELLNTLIEHHLTTNKMRATNFWKVILNITGAGGVLAALVYGIIEFFKFVN